MKHLFIFLLALFMVSHSFADELSDGPNEQLQEIIDLFQGKLPEDALVKLELHESDLVSSVRESKDAETYLLLGRTYFYAEMDEKATDAFKAALLLDQSLSDAHFFIGLIQRYANDYDSAKASFQNAIAEDNTNARYFLELGRTLKMQDELAAASTAYKNALSIDDAIFDAHFDLAIIYATEGNPDDTEKHLLAAIELKPDDLDTHYNLGQLYQNTKQHRSAIKQFERVVELAPNDWRAIAKLVQENEAVNAYDARDSAIEKIYDVWRANVDEELTEQGFYIREQGKVENGKFFVLEYFELNGERARKFVFKLRDELTGEPKFEVSLGSYEGTTEIARSIGNISPDQRLYHLDGYIPNGSHYTYAFFDSLPSYEAVKEIALKALADDHKVISSTVPVE